MRTFALQCHSYARNSMHAASSAGSAASKRSLMYLAFLGPLAVAQSAHAGISPQGSSFQGSSFQGSSFQGSSFQGSSFQGPHDAWLEGQTLLGWLHGEVIEVTGFRGVEVDVVSANQSLVLHPMDLVGLQWVTYVCDDEGWCANVFYRIDKVMRDNSQSTMPAFPSNSDIWLYQLEYAVLSEQGLSSWSNVCGQGNTRGLFVDGRWDDEGLWHSDGYSFSCPDGVIAKCARTWGYKPWKSVWLDGKEVNLQPLHLACTRAARADYCGDGVSYTQEGTLIDMFDVYGLNVREAIASFAPESSFDQDGSLWMERPRWDGSQLEATETDWIFPNCHIPRNSNTVPAGTALIHVWSDPALVIP